MNIQVDYSTKRDRVNEKITPRSSSIPEWTWPRVKKKKISKMLDYAPSKNKNPRAGVTHASIQVKTGRMVYLSGNINVSLLTNATETYVYPTRVSPTVGIIDVKSIN